jgi:crossover junction endodeoxyribonuclease RusA
MFVSERGVNFRHEVLVIVSREGYRYSGNARLKMSIGLNPPDKRKRDLDNPIKPLWDALQHAGLFDDDSQIDKYDVVRGNQEKGGKCLVLIETI